MLALISVFGNSVGTGNARISSIVHAIGDVDKVVVTSDFIHGQKKYISEEMKLKAVCYLHVPKYTQNLSLVRIYSHLIFAYKLWKYLKKISPSVVYCAMPTSTAAYICGRYCKKRRIKFVIDVIDLWPDSLMPLYSGFKAKILHFLLYPWKYITIQAYKYADVILGESKEYAMCAARYNHKASVYPIYLGVDLDYVNLKISQCALHIEKPANEIWIGYGGSLGTSYDFETLIRGVSELNGKFEYKLLFIGDGVCRHEVERLARMYSVNMQITGFVDYGTLLKYLSYCDIAINIFRSNTKVVHSYKFNDYVATNCFILNSLAGETAEMVDKYKVGLNFDFENHLFDKVLNEALQNWNYYKDWKLNNRNLVSEVLDKKVIYSLISNILI